MLINVKMPTIVGILTFMSRINFLLNLVEYEKSFITSGPDLIYMLTTEMVTGYGKNWGVVHKNIQYDKG